MAFTMHSHSGQFCPGHAKDQLEVVVKHAIAIGYKTMGLTEHMPRFSLGDLYPEELEPDPHASLAAMGPRHEAYLAEAARLQAAYADQVHILIGFEGEWMRPEYGAHVAALAQDPRVDYVVGSVHHGAGDVPLDLDRATYARARDASYASWRAAGGAGGDGHGEAGEAPLYAGYFDQQFDMLRAVRPRVVGHFDLVRLMSEDPGRDLSTWKEGHEAGVWEKVLRNLAFVASYGGWLECNTSALRKGLEEPYPAKPIAMAWLRLGGKFTFSDDSHGVAQLATNYMRGLDYLEGLGVGEVMTLERRPHPGAAGGTGGGTKAALVEKSVSLTTFRASLKV